MAIVQRTQLLPFLAFASLTACSNYCLGEDWPRWRGLDGNAVSSESPLPLHWSTKQNVRWKTPIPGEGFSSPIVWKDRVFLTSSLKEGTRRLVHCLDRQSGKILWSQEIADKDPERASAMT